MEPPDLAKQVSVVDGDRCLFAQRPRERQLARAETPLLCRLGQHGEPHGLAAEAQGDRKTALFAPALHGEAAGRVEPLVGKALQANFAALEKLAAERVLRYRVRRAGPVPGARLDLVEGLCGERVGGFVVDVDDAVGRPQGSDRLARDGVQHILEHDAGGDRPAGFDERGQPAGVLLLFVVDASVIDGQRRHAADRLHGGGLVGGERALRARVEQLDQADHRPPGDQRHREAAPLAVLPHVLELDLAQTFVPVVFDGERRPRLHGQLPDAPLVQHKTATLPDRVELVVFYACHAGELVGPGQTVDVAEGDVDGLTEALRRGQEHVLGLEAGSKGEARFGDEAGATVVGGKVTVQDGVGYRPRGELGQTPQQIQVREAAWSMVEQERLADLRAVGDQGQPQTTAIAVLTPRRALRRAHADVRLDVEDLDRLLPQALLRGHEELARRVKDPGKGLVDDVTLDAHQAARAAALPGADFTGGGAGDGAQPTGYRDDHFVQIERAADLQAGVDEGPQVDVVGCFGRAQPVATSDSLLIRCSHHSTCRGKGQGASSTLPRTAVAQ